MTILTTTAAIGHKPLNLARLLIWAGFVLLLIIAPMLFNKGASLSILSQIGTMMIFALSYNMLLGQGGMLSFGHAVYSGLGAFFAIHAMNLAGGGTIWMPLPLIPLVGGLAGMFFGGTPRSYPPAFSIVVMRPATSTASANPMLRRPA